MPEYKIGLARILGSNTQRVEVTGGATTNFNIIEGDLFKFQGELAFFQVGSIVSSTTFDLTGAYTGTKPTDTYLPYIICRNFTPRFRIPELAPGDIDIRDVYTQAMRIIDALLGGSANGVLAEFSFVGAITAGAKPFRWFPPIPVGTTAIVNHVLCSLGTPATGSSVIVDVNKNGTTVFTNQVNRPAVAAGQIVGVSGFSGVELGPTDYLTVDIDQIGAGTPGEDLLVQVRF